MPAMPRSRKALKDLLHITKQHIAQIEERLSENLGEEEISHLVGRAAEWQSKQRVLEELLSEQPPANKPTSNISD